MDYHPNVKEEYIHIQFRKDIQDIHYEKGQDIYNPISMKEHDTEFLFKSQKGHYNQNCISTFYNLFNLFKDTTVVQVF